MDRNFAILLKGGTVHSFDTVRLHKDGREIEISLALSPIRDPSGE